jgi:hypothetical protein
VSFQRSIGYHGKLPVPGSSKIISFHLLDGLDEVPPALQPDCVTAINTFVEKSTPSGLVVCCRLDEYRWLPERLKLNGAICIESLSSEEASTYLDKGGPELAALREAINTDPVLEELAQTPLMLNIMSLAFQGAGTSELTTQKGDSPEERRKQIFRLYVEQMFRRKGTTSLVFPKEKIIHWKYFAELTPDSVRVEDGNSGLEVIALENVSKGQVLGRPIKGQRVQRESDAKCLCALLKLIG